MAQSFPADSEQRSATPAARAARARIGVYGWGIVGPGARNVAALEALLRTGRTALRTSDRVELGAGLFATGDPDFDLND
ncbi:MAG TPA: hypothetical protein VII82_12865, partial [Polyangiaceae bacterium]